MTQADTSHQKSEFHPKKLKRIKDRKDTGETDNQKTEVANSENDRSVSKTEDLKIAADLVVKYLTPAFKEGRIASKVSLPHVVFFDTLLYLHTS